MTDDCGWANDQTQWCIRSHNQTSKSRHPNVSQFALNSRLQFNSVSSHSLAYGMDLRISRRRTVSAAIQNVKTRQVRTKLINLAECSPFLIIDQYELMSLVGEIVCTSYLHSKPQSDHHVTFSSLQHTKCARKGRRWTDVCGTYPYTEHHVERSTQSEEDYLDPTHGVHPTLHCSPNLPTWLNSSFTDIGWRIQNTPEHSRERYAGFRYSSPDPL